MLETERAVEIISPMYGSAYHIGGHLVLTCKHLFKAGEIDCCVRSKNTNKRFKATVVWRCPTSDVALVELLNGDRLYPPISFGRIPESRFGESISCEFYGFPEWGQTYDSENEQVAEIIHAKGEIRLAEVLSRKLHRFRVEENSIPSPRPGSESPWQGCSGAAIGSGGLTIAVQSEHLRGDNFGYLGVVPLCHIEIDEEWRSILKRHGINPEFSDVPVKYHQDKRSRKSPSPIESQVISLAQTRSQMTELLYGLDYEQQKYQFKESLKSNQKAGAFVIKAPCEHTRRWLVHRLMQEVPNHRNAIRLSIKPAVYFSEDDLWQGLASGLSKQLKVTVESDFSSIIECLCHRELSKPVIISIRDMDGTHESFEQLILCNFWEKLNQMMTHETCQRNRESRIILFVTKDTSSSLQREASQLLALSLAPLEAISQNDIAEWLSFLSGQKSQGKKGKVLLTKLRDAPMPSESSPGAVIHQLCKIVGLQKGILELESIWGNAS